MILFFNFILHFISTLLSKIHIRIFILPLIFLEIYKNLTFYAISDTLNFSSPTKAGYAITDNLNFQTFPTKTAVVEHEAIYRYHIKLILDYTVPYHISPRLEKCTEYFEKCCQFQTKFYYRYHLYTISSKCCQNPRPVISRKEKERKKNKK